MSVLGQRNQEIVSSPAIDVWIDDHRWEIAFTLLATRAYLEVRYKDHNGLPPLDGDRYSLSEMPLCRFRSLPLWNSFSLPVGIRSCDEGHVTVFNNPSRFRRQSFLERFPHCFFTDNGRGTVLCFCFGQFYDIQHGVLTTMDFIAGQRVARYQQRAPELVRVFELPAGLTFARLFGPADVIEAKLGLRYEIN